MVQDQGHAPGFADGTDDEGAAGGWVDDGTDIRLETGTDSVGIGTTSTTEKLQVAGNVQVDDTLFASNVSSNSPLRLQTAGTTRMYIDDASGNVGIGTLTPNPDYKLDVMGKIHGYAAGSNGVYAAYGETDGGYGVYGYSSGAGYGVNGTSINGYGIYGHSSSGYAGKFDGEVFVNGRFITWGNVGIGTASPGQKLDVDWGDLLVQGSGSFDSPGEEGIVYLGSIHHYVEGVYGFGVKIGTYAAGDVVSIREVSGNVGIGTTSPQGKLDVNGSIYQRGILLHADYVFGRTSTSRRFPGRRWMKTAGKSSKLGHTARALWKS